jgi:hypothetical protein
MPALTYTEIFGSDATLDTTEIENPKLVIPLLAISDHDVLGLGSNVGLLGISAIDITNIDFWANRIFYGFLLRYLQKQPATNTEPELPIYIINLGKKNVTRGGQAQVVYSLTVNAYINDPLTNVMSLNDLIA